MSRPRSSQSDTSGEFETLVRDRLRSIADAEPSRTWRPEPTAARSSLRPRRPSRAPWLALACLLVVATVAAVLHRSSPRVLNTERVGTEVVNPANSSGPLTSSRTSQASTLPVSASTPPAVVTSTTSALHSSLYVVKDGDTLDSIARDHKTTTQVIIALNGWADGRNHVLASGVSIFLPVP